jgi:hypothetical protein
MSDERPDRTDCGTFLGDRYMATDAIVNPIEERVAIDGLLPWSLTSRSGILFHIDVTAVLFILNRNDGGILTLIRGAPQLDFSFLCLLGELIEAMKELRAALALALPPSFFSRIFFDLPNLVASGYGMFFHLGVDHSLEGCRIETQASGCQIITSPHLRKPK